MKTGQVLDAIEAEFVSALTLKTNWGRNDVLTLYKDCVLKVLKKSLDDDLSQRDRAIDLEKLEHPYSTLMYP